MAISLPGKDRVMHRKRIPAFVVLSFVCLLLMGGFVLKFSTGSVRAASLCSAKSYGATGNGTTKDTAALQAALNACANGGVVELTSGTYLSGPLTIKNA